MADWYDTAEHAFEAIVGWVYATAVDPLVYSFGLMSWAERAFDGTSFLVAGVLQVNAFVPDGLSAGNQPVMLYVGNWPSQEGVTVAVR